MGDYTVQGKRLLPLHNLNDNALSPHSTIQSITMGIRIGDQKYAIGYIHKFDFTMKREAKPFYQIEPYPDVIGDDNAAAGINSRFTTAEFNEDTKYWPGEALEIVPGKMGTIDITLNRYSLYTANLMAAMLRATGGGVYDSVDAAPNLREADNPVIKYVNILQQVRPFDIYQIFVSPITGSVLWGRKFGGCWFTDVGEVTPESDKNEPIVENGKIQATNIRPLSSSLGKS
jgi:hypothetical protein